MPVSTFSRRKSSSRRQISSNIEEDQPKTNGRTDNGDNNQPRRGGAKAGSSSRRAEPPRGVDEDGDEEDDGDGRIDIGNFHNQPLGRAALGKLEGISKDWVAMEKQVRQKWGIVGDVATSVAEAAEGSDAEEGLNELDVIMKDLIDIGAEMQAHEKTITDIYQKVGQGVEIVDAADQYTQGVKTRMEEYTKKTSRQKYAKSAEYFSFKQGIFEIQFPDKAMPPINDFIPQEDDDDSDDDDELEIGGVTQNYNCPITLTPLDNPVTSEICGHSFSADAIRDTFRGSRDAIKKCPASGCNKSFKLSDLKPNKELAKKVKAWQRRARRAAENSDAEEIIE